MVTKLQYSGRSARWRASRERGELEGEEPSHTATTTRSRHKFSLPTHPRLAQRVVCVLPPSLVIGLWFRVPLVERFVHPRLNGSFNSSTERLVGGKLLKQFSYQVSVCLLLSKASEIIQKCSKNSPHTGHRGLDKLPDGSTSTRRPGGLLCPGTSPPEVRVSTKASRPAL